MDCFFILFLLYEDVHLWYMDIVVKVVIND